MLDTLRKFFSRSSKSGRTARQDEDPQFCLHIRGGKPIAVSTIDELNKNLELKMTIPEGGLSKTAVDVEGQDFLHLYFKGELIASGTSLADLNEKAELKEIKGAKGKNSLDASKASLEQFTEKLEHSI
jgi:hypothetical protein